MLELDGLFKNATSAAAARSGARTREEPGTEERRGISGSERRQHKERSTSETRGRRRVSGGAATGRTFTLNVGNTLPFFSLQMASSHLWRPAVGRSDGANPPCSFLLARVSSFYFPARDFSRGAPGAPRRTCACVNTVNTGPCSLERS